MFTFAVMSCCTLLGYWVGVRGQRYTQARADVRDNRGKLRKSRRARALERRTAVAGWLVLGGWLVLVLVVVLTTT